MDTLDAVQNYDVCSHTSVIHCYLSNIINCIPVLEIVLVLANVTPM